MIAQNFPHLSTPFVGRSEELAEIAALMTDATCRVITLVGPGGIGKTRLALEATRQHPFPDQIYFVPLQPLTSANFIISTIANAIGFQFDAGNDPKQQLLDYLKVKSWHLVLDNFEHLLDGATLLSELLAYAPALRLIVTSRERLNLVEEWVLDVGGLAYPSSEDATDVEGYSAVKLFTLQARRAKSSFRLTDMNRSSVVRICRLVDGMPLAIELAASWIRVLSCDALANEIERSLDILETQARNVEPRHRTIRAAFVSTWNRLTEQERRVFMRLSIFHGGFTPEAAVQVAWASLHILSSLIDKSLLRTDESGRLNLQELLRQFAAEKLNETGEVASTAYQHLQYYVTQAEIAEAQFYRSEGDVWLSRFKNELDNLRAALSYALENHYAEKGLRLASALRWFWEGAPLLAEGMTWLTRSLAVEPTATNAIRAKALNTAGQFGIFLEDIRTEAFLQEALTLARAGNDRLNIAWALGGLGLWLQHQQRDAEAIPLYDESLALLRGLDDPFALGHLLRRRACVALELADYDYASALLDESLINARAMGSKLEISLTLLFLADLSKLRDRDFDRSAVLLEEAISLVREVSDTPDIAMLQELGVVEFSRGNVAGSAERYRELLIFVRENETDMGYAGAECLAGFGMVAMSEGNLERAAQLFGAAAPYHNHWWHLSNFDDQVASLRMQMDPTAFAKAWDLGHSMTSEQAYIYALDGDDSSAKGADFRQPTSPSLVEPLTVRELEVLHLMAEGLSNAEIAQQLVIALETVKVHARNIYGKLGVKGRAKAVIQAQTFKLL